MERLIKGHTTKNAKVIMKGGCCYLKSYSTLVIKIEDGRMVVTGLYSATTRRHIGWFLKDVCNGRFSYHDIKKANNLGYAINVFTGEPLVLTEEEKEFIRENNGLLYSRL